MFEESLLPGLSHLVGTLIEVVVDYEGDDESLGRLVVRTATGLNCKRERETQISFIITDLYKVGVIYS